MAAVNYIKNRRCQQIRQRLEHFVARCLDGDDYVDLEKVVEILQTTNLSIEEKEMEKLSSIANQDKIPKAKFVEFCKSSPTVKRLLEAEVREGRSRSSSRSATNTPTSLRKLTNRDKAAMAFKAVDTDRSGFLDRNEFTNFTRDRLFVSLDKDGDGKIDLKEFEVLFKK